MGGGGGARGGGHLPPLKLSVLQFVGSKASQKRPQMPPQNLNTTGASYKHYPTLTMYMENMCIAH